MKKHEYEIRVYVGKEIAELLKQFEKVSEMQPSRALRLAIIEKGIKEYLEDAIEELSNFKDEYYTYNVRKGVRINDKKSKKMVFRDKPERELLH